jgi:hypothetical protein
MDVIDHQDNRFGEVLECPEEKVVGSRPVMGKARVKSQEGVGSGQRQFARRGLDRPNDTVKQPRGLRVEPVK